MSGRISTPITTEDVTPEWLSQMLGVKISSENFLVTPNAHAGSGFMSNMLRISCEQEDDPKKSVKIIVKLLPPEGLFKDAILLQKFDKSEINFYRFMVPDLVAELPELEKFFCPFLGGEIQEENEDLNLKYSSVMILEDLKPQNYYIINFAQEMSEDQIKIGVDFMAKFHFASQCIIDKRKSTFASEYPFLQNLANDGLLFFVEGIKTGLKDVIQILAENSADPTASEAYLELYPHSTKILEFLQNINPEFFTAHHGDLWSNNFLFTDDPDKSLKIIDWQLAGYQDPAYDLAVLLVSSLPPGQLKPEVVEKYKNMYFDIFVEYAKKEGREHLIQRDRESFSKFFYTYAMSYTFVWFSFSAECFIKNIPKYVRIFEFLHSDMHIPKFLLGKINKPN